MAAAITAIGTAVPKYKQEQLIAAEIVANSLSLKPHEKRLLKSVYRSTGIERRYSVLNDFCDASDSYELFPQDPSLPFPTTAARMRAFKQHALPLALDAIQKMGDIPYHEITHVITVSCTGMYAPGLDIEIALALKLNQSVKRTCVNFMGCYGAFNAMKLADVICRAEPHAKVLVVSVELCTIHLQKNESMDNIFSNAIFSDGAAAILVEGEPANKKRLSLDAFHCDLLPQNSKDMAWEISDSGFDIVLSSYIPQAVETGIHAFMTRLLKDNALSFEHIDLFAIHPGGQKILKACEAALNITAEDNRYSYQVLKQFGNMSSATVLFVLNELWQDIKSEDQDKKIFSCAFGPGLTFESMILSVNNGC